MGLIPRSRKERRREADDKRELDSLARSRSVVTPPGTSMVRNSNGTWVSTRADAQAAAADPDEDGYWIRLGAGGSGGYYAYTRVYRDNLGVWHDTTQTGTVGGTGDDAPAFEVNETTGLPTKRFRGWTNPSSGEVEFQGEECA